MSDTKPAGRYLVNTYVRLIDGSIGVVAGSHPDGTYSVYVVEASRRPLGLWSHIQPEAIASQVEQGWGDIPRVQ